MLKKLSGYSVLSILSFSLFTLIFHTVASAQTSPNTVSFLAQNTLSSEHSPTPTVYAFQTSTQQAPIAKQPESPTSVPIHIPSPTPTIYTAPTNQPTPTATPTPSNVTPTTTPIPTVQTKPTITVVADLETLFSKYSEQYHADKELLKKIAKCESGFNATSNNSGMYLGMFQFAASTWISNRNAMGVDPNPDLRTNPEEAIRTAAYMIGMGRKAAWPNCH